MKRTIRLTLPAEIQSLPPLTGYIAIAGYSRARIHIAARYLATQVPAFVPRPTVAIPEETRAGRDTHYEYTKIWAGMKDRCDNPRAVNYAAYGGRGITYHGAWQHDYKAFEWWLDDNIGIRPGANYSLDRIDNDGGYEPGNLRWADKAEQAANRRKRAAGVLVQPRTGG